MKKIFENPVYAVLLAIVCTALWGSAVPIVKLGYEVMDLDTANTYGKMLFAGVRFFIASIALFGFAIFGLKLDVKIKNMKMLSKVTTLGLMQTTFQYSFMYIGVSFTTAAKSSILTSTGIFFIAILAHFIYKNDKLTPNKVLGLISGFTGIVIASLGKSGGINFEFALLGEGLIIAYQLCSAIASIFAKNFSKDI
ncbi:DMT family transporter, partial [Vallitalea okinawensis]|uniref:DMT family transporter n=1 Tax=Vallitalea okinawensis TaxID=2078660 RepID=UPI00147886BD